MKPGTIVEVNMGVSEGKFARVVPMSIVPRDGRGIPQVGKGHYNPIEPTDVAIRYLADNTLDVFAPVHLKRMK